MTLAEKLRELIKQPQGDEKAQEYIKHVLNDPTTRREIAQIQNLKTSNEVPQTL